MKNSMFYVNLLYFSIYIIGIHCIHLGLISPIEVVEEWGCHDTEIRLTCGHLDSKIAVLEATFTPNCTHEDCLKLDMKRLVRVFSPHKTTADPRGAEKEAGRKFLETLRRTHPHRTEEENEDDGEDDNDDVDASDKNGDVEILSGTTEGYYGEKYPNGPSADPLISQKKKNPSLRTTLERLIIRYLRKLSPDDDFSMNNNRRDRGMRYRRDVGSGDEPNNSAEVKEEEESDIIVAMDKNSDSVFSGGGNVNEINSGFGENEMSSSEELHRIQESRSYCMEQKREIYSLSKYDLDRSYQNESDEDYNIRRVLNKRCSGKNHCSFIFAIDHPFSKVWESGIVRVKYICMEDFRVNKYCGEHLTIDYEVDPKIQIAEADKRGPVASPRKQPRDTTALHSVKILRAGDSEESEMRRGSVSNDSRKRKIKIQSSKLQEPAKNSKEQNSRVYSQDFRMLKILPSNLDDFNDIEKIGDEIYFRKDGDILNEGDKLPVQPPEPPVTQEKPFAPRPTYPTLEDITSEEDLKFFVFPTVVMPSLPSDYATDSLHATVVEPNDRIEDLNGGFISPPSLDPYHTPSPKPFRKFEKITLTIREGKQVVIRFPLNRTIESSSSITTTNASASAIATTATSSATSSATDTTSTTATPPNAWILDNLIMPVNASHGRQAVTVTETAKDRSQQQLNTFSTSTSTIEYKSELEKKPVIEEIIVNEIEINSTLPSVHGGPLIVESVSGLDTNRDDYDEDDDGLEEDEDNIDDIDDDEDDDDDEEDEDYDFQMRHRKKMYASIQRTSFRAPLMHGFAMTPGYPKFYIGDSECKWAIMAPGGLKIRFTILDISLRFDESECRDYIQILDLKMNRTLFNSCSESIRPLEIVSDSNRVEVIVKTTTKFAYPKRGVLLHYTAYGCVIPPPPNNGRLIERTPTAAIYECDPSFVFPDTGVSKRQLSCTERDIWDKIVPDCIEQEYIVQRNGFVTDIEIILNKKPPDVHVHYENTKNVTKMTTKDADTIFDIVIPSVLMAGLFIINGFVFAVIMKYRKRQKSEGNSIELNEL